MAEKLGEAVLELKTGDKGFQRGVDRAEARAKQLGRTLDDVGRKAQQVGQTISTFVTLPIVALGALSVKTASDVQEMQNLFAVTFGDAADDVERWANRTEKAVNRSRFELMRTAADFAAFLKPLGVAPDQIVPMSKALTQLTVDIGSFRNMTEEETFTRLFSGLAGETEAVRRLGIDIGQAAIEAELLALGIDKNMSEATQAEKVMARYSLIMKQTADSQGDAARTAGSFENQTKALGATIQLIRVEVGQRLLPIAQRLIQRLRELGQQFLALPGNVKSGIVAVTAFVATIGPAIFALGLLVRAVGFAVTGLAFIPKTLRLVARAIKVTLIGIQVATVAFLAFFSTIPGLIIVSLAAIIGGFFIFKGTIIGFFKGLIVALKNEFVAGFNNNVVIPFQRKLSKLVSILPDSVADFMGLEPIAVNDVIDHDFTDEFTQVMAEAKVNAARELEAFKTTAGSIAGAVKQKFGEISTAVTDFIPDIELADLTLEGMGANFNELLAKLRTQMQQMSEGAANAGKNSAEAFDEFGQTIKSSITDNLTDALTRIKSFGDAARSILNAVLEALIRTQIVQPLVAALPIPTFAHGGRHPNSPFIAGERGPELVIPDSTGTVIPNHELGGMGGITQNFDIGMVFPPQLEAVIRNIAGPAGRAEAIAVMQAHRGGF